MDARQTQDAASAAVELIFLGTGTSSSSPHIECLTASSDDKQCRTCLSTLQSDGKKNIRRNTSVALRVVGLDGHKSTIVIDVGKNFQAAALEWFPKYGLRHIDAVLITHAHADAMNGLDDLRGWTLRGAIQPHIDVYVSQATFVEVQRSFPYLVSKEFASGGGDVPEFKWHIIEDRCPFEIGDTGIQITPFAVHHGRLFTTGPAPPAFIPTPTTHPSTPTMSGASTPARQSIIVSTELETGKTVTNQIHPYFCFSFNIQDDILYMSDVSHIPEDVWTALQASKRTPSVFVIDCLRLDAHTSHYGLKECVETARQLGANRTYMTGFGHEVAQDEYVALGEMVGHTISPESVELSTVSVTVQLGAALIGEGRPIWLRPAYDGLRVFMTKDGNVWDEGFDTIL